MPYSLSKQHLLLSPIGTGVYRTIPESCFYNSKSPKSPPVTRLIARELLSNKTSSYFYNASVSIVNRSNHSISKNSSEGNKALQNESLDRFGFVLTNLTSNTYHDRSDQPHYMASLVVHPPLRVSQTIYRCHSGKNTSPSAINLQYDQSITHQDCQGFSEIITSQISVKNNKKEIDNHPCQSSCCQSTLSKQALLVSLVLENEVTRVLVLNLGAIPNIPIKRLITKLVDLPKTEVVLGLETPRLETENNQSLQISV